MAVLHRAAFARAVFALSIVFVLAMAPAAFATPVEGPSGSAFYTPPAPTPAGSAGELVWYRPATVNLNVTLPAVKAWTVLYQSTDQHGQPDWVTGTVIVPTASWRGSGTRPVVTYAEGTQGLAQSCAPSLQMAAGTEYDGGAIIESLKKGYAVTVTDYQGYTNGAIPTYIAGKAEGQAVLDVVRAGQAGSRLGHQLERAGDRLGLLAGRSGCRLGRRAPGELRPRRENGGRRRRRSPRQPAGDRANSITLRGDCLLARLTRSACPRPTRKNSTSLRSRTRLASKLPGSC